LPGAGGDGRRNEEMLVKEYKFPVVQLLGFGDLMYSIGIIVDNII